MEITIKLEASRDLIAALLSLAGITQTVPEEASVTKRSRIPHGSKWTEERKEYLRENFHTLRMADIVMGLNQLPGPPISYNQAGVYAGNMLSLRKNSTDPSVVKMRAALAAKRAARAA